MGWRQWSRGHEGAVLPPSSGGCPGLSKGGQSVRSRQRPPLLTDMCSWKVRECLGFTDFLPELGKLGEVPSSKIWF